jgi:hypothetical protein
MPRRASKREDEGQAAVRVIRTAVERTEKKPALVPGVADEDPNTGRRIKKKARVIDPAVSAAAAALSKLGASKGGTARAENVSPKRRAEIAKKAAETRWMTRSSK